MNEPTDKHKNHRKRNWEVWCCASHNTNNYTCLIQHMLQNQHLNTHPECKINWRAESFNFPLMPGEAYVRIIGVSGEEKKKWKSDRNTWRMNETKTHRERDQSIIRRSFSLVSNTAWNQTQSTYQNRNIKHEKNLLFYTHAYNGRTSTH